MTRPLRRWTRRTKVLLAAGSTLVTLVPLLTGVAVPGLDSAAFYGSPIGVILIVWTVLIGAWRVARAHFKGPGRRQRRGLAWDGPWLPTLVLGIATLAALGV